MNEKELQQWFNAHGPEVGRKNNYGTKKIYNKNAEVIGEERVIVSTTIEAQDGATITLTRLAPEGTGDPGEGAEGPRFAEYSVEATTPPDKTRQPPQRTPEQQRSEIAAAQMAEEKWNREVQDNNERSWNMTAPGGSGKNETHAERAEREQKERLESDRREAKERQDAIDRQRAENDRLDREQRAADAEANRNLTQQQIDIQRGREEREANKPQFLSQADTKSEYIVRYNPATGQMDQVRNPNYDAVQVEAERKRAELELQIRQRQIGLEEAKAQYSQWFDTNVKTPLMLAQEARAQAEEKRQALEAEERRRQFASDFKLRKAQLGETAAGRATQAEISLLPYRTGPTGAAEMSSAINSLAAGGKIDGPDASAGVNFTPGGFQFSAPDFRSIARRAAQDALKGVTDYRPSDEGFPTGDYSGVPQVNLTGAPAMPAMPAYSLPAPSPGAAEPTY